jgi:hypothetical protein
MADEQQVSEEVVTQEPDAPQPEVQEAETEATAEPEVDWKAQAERLEQQLKTEQGRSRKRDDTDTAILGIGDRMVAMEQSNAALIKALAEGDTENLPQQLTQIQAQSQNNQRGRTYQSRYEALTGQLRGAMQDVEGNEILSLYEAPELEEVRQSWVEAHKNKSMAGLYSTLVRAHEVVRQTERSKAAQMTDSVRQEERTSAKQRLEEAGIYDLDTGPASAGGGATKDDDTWFREYGKMDSPTPADHARARRINKRR